MNLPTWTRDAGTMKRDIDEHGYCLVKEALTPEQLAEARERSASRPRPSARPASPPSLTAGSLVTWEHFRNPSMATARK